MILYHLYQKDGVYVIAATGLKAKKEIRNLVPSGITWRTILAPTIEAAIAIAEKQNGFAEDKQ